MHAFSVLARKVKRKSRSKKKKESAAVSFLLKIRGGSSLCSLCPVMVRKGIFIFFYLLLLVAKFARENRLVLFNVFMRWYSFECSHLLRNGK